jgi:hypothetical protein
MIRVAKSRKRRKLTRTQLIALQQPCECGHCIAFAFAARLEVLGANHSSIRVADAATQ